MPVTKTTTVLSNNINLTAGGGPTTSSAYSATVGWHKILHMKLTNGATPPTTPASVRIEGSPDNSNWYTFQSGFTGPTTANGVESWSVLMYSAVQYVRVVWTHGDTQNVTARAEVCDATEIAESVTSTSATSVGAADTSNNSVRTNLYNEIGTSFAHTQTSVGTSAVQLGNNTAIKGVLVKAKSTNTGIIYVGNSSGVTSSTGFELLAGEAVLVPVSNSNLIYCIASASSQSVCLLVT